MPDAISLNAGQNEALQMAVKLASTSSERAGAPAIGVLSGVAGSGKTTSLKAITEAVGGSVILSPTGKAAVRVKEATGFSASTIHRWMYKPSENSNGDIDWVMRGQGELARPDSGLIIIDEASMVGLELWEDIYTAASLISCNLLVVGDYEQLPPVTKDKDAEPFSVLAPNFKCDYRVNLTEILRQAQDNPIIKATMDLRSGNWMNALMQIRQVPQSEMLQEANRVVGEGGVVLCYKNSTRHYFNQEIRKMRGLGEELVQGEPLLVMRNSYDLNIFNGETAAFQGWDYLSDSKEHVYDNYNKRVHYTTFGKTMINGQTAVLSVDEIFGTLEGCPPSSLQKAAKLRFGKRTPYINMNLGYALTTHKSQGSEFPEVFVIVEDSLNPEHKDGRRHLYTSLTRTSGNVSVCWKPKLPKGTP
jgi:exodeoxyribonuclease-5